MSRSTISTFQEGKCVRAEDFDPMTDRRDHSTAGEMSRKQFEIDNWKKRAEQLFAEGRGAQACFLTQMAFEAENGAAWYEIMKREGIRIAPEPQERIAQ